MMNIMHFYEAGKLRSGSVLIPFFDTVNINIWRFSTRHGNAKVKWGDGNETDYVLTKNIDLTSGGTGTSMSHTYATPYTGDVEVIFKQGLKDVYSLNVVYWSKGTNNGLNEQRNKINIQDFGTYIKKFSNLYSYFIDTYSYNTPIAQPIIKGDLADIPESVERIKITSFEVLNNSTDVWFNFNSLPVNSKLKFIDLSGQTGNGTARKILGDLSKIPIYCSFIRINSTINSSITYTAGKVWASSFDTLSIPLPLTTPELDNLLIDMDNSITTKIGDGVIALGGWRSATSDVAVASLQAKGFTVNIKLKSLVNDSSVVFRMDFQNNYNVWSNSLIDINSGNGLGSEGNLPTFALSGRKPGEYCAVFNGSQSIKTTTNLPVNSDKVTIAFWMKTTQTGAAVIAETSTNYVLNNAFGVFINDTLTNRVEIADRTTSPAGTNLGNSAVNINNGNWFHVVLTIDRNLGVTQNQIYINGSLSYTQHASYVANLVGNFVNNILFIGQRAGSSLGFNGSLTKLKLYNYPLTAGEVSTLYNSEL